MKNAIEVNNLTKKHKNFLLDNVSFNVPNGFICGFIGQNGAGKTTTMKLILNMALKDSGEIKILDKSSDDISVKEHLGVLLDQPYFHESWTAIDVEKAMCPFYKSWDSNAYHQYLQQFSLNPNQKFKTLSRGMKMKLGMATALSHNARLLLLDEPTSGLDPIMRDEMLGILRDYMALEERSVFFSTHITSDLEKIADFIVYIHRGQIIYSGLKDELTEKYCLIRGGKDDLPSGKRQKILGFVEHPGGFEGMIDVSHVGGFPSTVIMESATLEDIMVHINREGNKEGNFSFGGESI